MKKTEFSHNLPDVNRFVKTNWDGVLYNKIQDPTVLCFKFMVDFNSGFGLFDQSGSTNSALSYLKRTGETVRVQYLQSFIENFKSLVNNEPWFFQTITGLEELWEHDFDKFDTKGKVISITTLETIDQRVTNCIDLYRKACFDWRLKREVVPLNLRQFDCLIYVFERRGFRLPDRTNELKQSLDFMTLFGYDKQFGLKDDLGNGATCTRQMFHLEFCEFNANASKKIFDFVSNKEGDYASQNIEFTYKKNTEENVYTLWDNFKLNDDAILKLDNSVFSELISLDARSNNSGINGQFPEIPIKDKKFNFDKIEDIGQKIIGGNLNFLGIKYNFEQQLDVGNAKNILVGAANGLVSSAIGRIINENIKLNDSISKTNTAKKESGVVNSGMANDVIIVQDSINKSKPDLTSTVKDTIPVVQHNKDILIQNKKEQPKNLPTKTSGSIDTEHVLNIDIVNSSIMLGDSLGNRPNLVADKITNSLSLSTSVDEKIITDKSNNTKKETFIKIENSLNLEGSVSGGLVSNNSLNNISRIHEGSLVNNLHLSSRIEVENLNKTNNEPQTLVQVKGEVTKNEIQDLDETLSANNFKLLSKEFGSIHKNDLLNEEKLKGNIFK